MPPAEQSFDWLDHGVCIPYPSFLKFEGVLRRDDQILGLMLDDQFAQTMSDILASGVGEVVDVSSGELLKGSSDDFRALVAHYRNKGESYVDFIGGIVEYPMPKHIAARVVEELRRLGWRVTGPSCFHATREELAELGYHVGYSRFDEAAFGSWVIELVGPRRRIIWDGKERTLVVQTKSLLQGWKDRTASVELQHLTFHAVLTQLKAV